MGASTGPELKPNATPGSEDLESALEEGWPFQDQLISREV